MATAEFLEPKNRGLNDFSMLSDQGTNWELQMEEIFLEVTWAGDMKVRKDLGQYTNPRGKVGILRRLCHTKVLCCFSDLFPVPFSGGRPGCNPYSAIFLLCDLEYSP